MGSKAVYGLVKGTRGRGDEITNITHLAKIAIAILLKVDILFV